jgi:hypothetical protein
MLNFCNAYFAERSFGVLPISYWRRQERAVFCGVGLSEGASLQKRRGTLQST